MFRFYTKKSVFELYKSKLSKLCSLFCGWIYCATLFRFAMSFTIVCPPPSPALPPSSFLSHIYISVRASFRCIRKWLISSYSMLFMVFYLSPVSSFFSIPCGLTIINCSSLMQVIIIILIIITVTFSFPIYHNYLYLIHEYLPK